MLKILIKLLCIKGQKKNCFFFLLFGGYKSIVTELKTN